MAKGAARPQQRWQLGSSLGREPIARVEGRVVGARIERREVASRESPLEVTLAQGVSRGSRMDYTVQKAVELGVARVAPVLTRRGIVRLDTARAGEKRTHWQAVAIAACQQCGRNRVPEVGEVRTLAASLARWRSGREGELGVVLDPAAECGLRELPRPPAGVTLLAGPEGGLTGEERQTALRAGFVAVRLGPRVLRTETAALAALAAMQALWGDF